MRCAGNEQIDTVDDLGGRQDTAWFHRHKPVADAAGKIGALHQPAAGDRNIAVGICTKPGYNTAFRDMQISIRHDIDAVDCASGGNMHYAAADRGILNRAAADDGQKTIVPNRPSVIVSVFCDVDMVKIAVSVDIQIRYLRIRGKKSSVLVKEHAIRTVHDIGGNGKAKIVLHIQIETIRDRFDADGIRAQRQSPD